MRNSPRRRRQIASLGSLSDVIGDLSLLAFQPKPKVSLQSTDDELRENQQNEIAIGNCKEEFLESFIYFFCLVLSELLTYSDCHSADKPMPCGFGEYGMF
jgi:hypothetical protein